MKVGDEYVGKLNNEFKGKVISITEEMLDDDEHLYHFLHYFGFEKLN